MTTAHNQAPAVRKKKGSISYAKWGYIFLIPFFLVYTVFSLVPLVSVFWNSFFENYMSGLTQIGPNFVGFENYGKLFESGLTKYFSNTVIIWVLGFIPQILISLLLASWFTNLRLRLRATGIFKTIIYMPNLNMASAFALLFFVLFSDAGPMNDILMSLGVIDAARRAALPAPGGMVCARSGAQGSRARHTARRQRAPQELHPRQQPGRLHRKSASV
jgi:multiple sugar transport system permease protein